MGNIAQLQDRIKVWLNDRTISDEVICDFNLSYQNNGHYNKFIVIPIFDLYGKFLFNKYRRDPSLINGSKYSYDKGGTTILYGMHKAKDYDEIIICEGELDALALWSHNYPAVSPTSGSSCFKEEWAEYFKDKKVWICYDNDIAGYKGAFNVQRIIPHANIILLPQKRNINDITDYFIESNRKDMNELFLSAKRYEMSEIDKDKCKLTKKRRGEIIKIYNERVNKMMEEGQDKRSKYESDGYCQPYIDYHLKLINAHRKIINMKKPKPGESLENIKINIDAAKEVSMERFIQFNYSGFANCIWHDERTPSMHYYSDDNKVKCFGCDRSGDVIDVVQQLNSVDFKEAVNIILNK